MPFDTAPLSNRLAKHLEEARCFIETHRTSSSWAAGTALATDILATQTLLESGQLVLAPVAVLTPESPWKPIASAPKDGRWILVAAHGAESQQATWLVDASGRGGWYATADTPDPMLTLRPDVWQELPRAPARPAQDMAPAPQLELDVAPVLF